MIQEFLEYQAKNKGLAEQSVEGYRKELKAFTRWASPRGLRWSTLTSKDVDAYVRDEQERGMKPRTIKKRVETLRLLYNWANHQGLLTENPARYTQTPKWGEELPKAADEQRIIEYIDSPATTREGMLVHAIVTLIYETGMRIGEVTSMRGTDIDTEQHTIRLTGKGNVERVVLYGKRFERYAEMMSKNHRIIFYENQETYRYMMYRELPGVNPHAIRHTFACSQLGKGMPLKSVSTLMGHKHIETTEIYARLSLDNIKNQYQQIN